MKKDNEVWVVFRGELHTSGPKPDWFSGLEQVAEIIKAEKISNSYVKLTESPLFHPNVSYGDIFQVEQSEDLDDNVAVIEFSGYLEDENDKEQEKINGLGTALVDMSPESLKKIMKFDSQIKPIIHSEVEKGNVYSPIKFMSHGTYKINILFDYKKEEDLKVIKDYFNKSKVYFQPSSNKGFGSVSFSNTTKFKDAVACLENAKMVFSCAIAFDPEEFPLIDFSTDLIPNNDQTEGL